MWPSTGQPARPSWPAAGRNAVCQHVRRTGDAHRRVAPPRRRIAGRRHRKSRWRRWFRPDERHGDDGRATRLAAASRRARHHPIPVRTERPAEVGADRLVNGWRWRGCTEPQRSSSIFGTATTFELHRRDGGYIGGAITPGHRDRLEALASRTAPLPRIDLRGAHWAIAPTRVSAMQFRRRAGLPRPHLGLIGANSGRAGTHREVEESAIQVVLTGGLSAAPWARDLPGVDAIDRN